MDSNFPTFGKITSIVVSTSTGFPSKSVASYFHCRTASIAVFTASGSPEINRNSFMRPSLPMITCNRTTPWIPSLRADPGATKGSWRRAHSNAGDTADRSLVSTNPAQSQKTSQPVARNRGDRTTGAGSPNVGRQLQDTETGYGRKVAIIRKKSCAAGCQCRYNLQRIRRLDSRCGS
jgi:hypothetical protein